jgi:hypothetical protein
MLKLAKAEQRAQAAELSPWWNAQDVVTSGFLYHQADEVVDNVEQTKGKSKPSGWIGE